MKILLVGDEPSKALWDFYDETKLQGIDLILSSGDLPAEYLSFLVTFASCPVLYIHGNHDDCYETKPPEGCICIEDMVYEYQGLRILGLGGSFRYKAGKHQFSERQMQWRIRKLYFQIRKKKGFDILLTHAPAFGVDDRQDLPHRGFQAFLPLLKKYQPQYMIHGHVHMNYGYQIKRELQYENTRIINSYEKYILEI